MMTFEEFKTRWNSIPMFYNSYLGIDSEHPLNINIGYADANEKTLYVLDAYEVENLPSSRSIFATCSQMDNEKWTFSFKLIQPENEEVFMRLCWDLVESSRTAYTNTLPFFLKRYTMWQKLLEQARPDIMSASRQKGLFGEITYLLNLIDLFGAEKAVSSWSGPEGADQDFIYDDTWAEVKSIALASANVTISSLEQLDTENDGYLVVYRIEKTTAQDAHGITLYDIVQKTQTLLAEGTYTKEQFELKLFLYGYKDSQEYNRTSYKYWGDEHYFVSKDFPRLTKKNLPNEISFAKYGLNLATIEIFKK